MRKVCLLIISAQLSFSALVAQVTISGTLTNEGTITVDSDWSVSNNGTYTGSGEVVMKASSDRQINMRGGTFTVLTIDGSNVAVVSELFISGSLEMLSGNVETGSADLVIQNGANITNAGPNSYVDGPLFIDLTGSNGGSMTYPVGTGGQYLPITLQGIDATGTHGYEVIDTRLNGGDRFDALAPRHWERINFGNSTFNGANVTLPVLGDEGFQSDDLTVIEANSRNELVTEVLSNYQGGNTISSLDPVTQTFVSIGEIGIPLIVTNVITPNGDMQNDILFIQNIDQFPENQVQIINRWGIEVYSSSAYDNENVFWDGTVDGKIAAPGNYIAVIKTSKRTIKQTISLIR